MYEEKLKGSIISLLITAITKHRLIIISMDEDGRKDGERRKEGWRGTETEQDGREGKKKGNKAKDTEASEDVSVG